MENLQNALTVLGLGFLVAVALSAYFTHKQRL